MAALETLVYRVVGDRPIHVDGERWDNFCRGAEPLDVESLRDGRLNVLVLRLRGTTCESVEATAVDVDEHGYLKRLHVVFEPLPSTRVLDARSAFLGRYLRHTYRWEPSEELIVRALASANAWPLGAEESVSGRRAP
jgi:hypothetical protein